MFLSDILFGLSLYYRMLLLSRIEEASDEGYSTQDSVESQLARVPRWTKLFDTDGIPSPT